jgi:peroxiredoxin Q/BCP
VVEEGRPAPSFSLPSDGGERVSLDALRGRPVVLYFYPKDERLGIYDSRDGRSAH